MDNEWIWVAGIFAIPVILLGLIHLYSAVMENPRKASAAQYKSKNRSANR